MRCGGGRGQPGSLMVLFLLTVGWKMRAFIWTAVQNAVVKVLVSGLGTNLRDIPDSEEGKGIDLPGGRNRRREKPIRPIINIWKNRKSGRSIWISWHSFPGVGWWMELYLENGTGLFMEVGRQGGGETDEERLYSAGKNGEKTERANPAALVDSPRLRKKLEDYDYLIQHFYNPPDGID